MLNPDNKNLKLTSAELNISEIYSIVEQINPIDLYFSSIT
jgi:hypothetical protein